MGRSRFPLVGVALVGAVLAAERLPAEPSPAFAVRAWGPADGLVEGPVRATARDDEGHLWIATSAGLVRFDGLAFESLDAQGDMPAGGISALHRGPTGRLWIGTDGGDVLEHRDGGFVGLDPPPPGGRRVASLAEDDRGVLWASRERAADRPGPALVWQLEGGALVPRGDLDELWLSRDERGGPAIRTTSGGLRSVAGASLALDLSRDAEGAVWGHLAGGRLVRLADGLTDPLGTSSPAFSGRGGQTLFTREERGLVEVHLAPTESPAVRLRSRSGQTVWLADRRGLFWESAADEGGDWLRAYRAGNGSEAVVEIPVGDTVRHLAEDAEGDLWVGTARRGILRISEVRPLPLEGRAGAPEEPRSARPATIGRESGASRTALLVTGLGLTGAVLLLGAGRLGARARLRQLESGLAQRERELETERRLVAWQASRLAEVDRRGGAVDASGSASTTPTGHWRVSREPLPSGDDASEGTPPVEWIEGPEVPAEAPVEAAVSIDGGDRTTVLVVHAGGELRALLRQQLADDYRVLEAGNEERALETFERGQPDLVVSGAAEPGLDGLALCRAIRSHPESGHVPVVLVSAETSPQSRVEGFECGADAYLPEPFHPAEMRAVIDGLIASRKRLRDRYAGEARERSASRVPLPAVEPDGDPEVDRRYKGRLEDVIEDTLHDEDLTIDQLGQLVAQSRASLYRHVKRLYGVSPSELLRRRRLERAAWMLVRCEGSVGEVAYAVGFKSTAHFSNAFQDHYGVRPSKAAATARAAGELPSSPEPETGLQPEAPLH